MDAFLKRTKYYTKEWCRPKHPPIHTLFVTIMCSLVYFTDRNISLETPPLKTDPWWVYPASSVSHWTNIHFASNMLSIIAFGTLLEIVHGSFASFMIFWYSCLNGTLWHVALELENTLYRGASPGVYGLIGSYLAHVIINWKEAPYKCFWITLLILEAINITILYNTSDVYRTIVAHWSHAFGFIQGTLLSLIVLKNMVVNKWELWIQFVACVSSAGLIMLSITIIYTP